MIWRSSTIRFVWVALFATNVVAKSEVFYASAVSYCSAARAIEVKEFLLQYDSESIVRFRSLSWPAQPARDGAPTSELTSSRVSVLPAKMNSETDLLYQHPADIDKTISFDINAASVEPDTRAIISLQLTAYGIQAVNVSINLCTTLSGVMCPLPQYNFVASATLPLPTSIQDEVKIPAIGYRIPDLEAVATVRLLSVANGSEATCLRVRLSNGESVRWAGVSWATAGLMLGAIVLGLLRMFVNFWQGDTEAMQRGRTKERLLEIIGWYQFVAVSGLLSLDYPLIYNSFTTNFAWALGLVYIQPFQQSIDDLRDRTGGNLTRLAGSLNLVGGTEKARQVSFATSSRQAPNLDRRSIFLSDMLASLRPSAAFNTSTSWNARGSRPWTSNLQTRLAEVADHAVTTIKKRALNGTDRATTAADYAVPKVTEQDTYSSLDFGIPRFVFQWHISPYNAFMTVFLSFLLLLAFLLAVAIILAIPFGLMSWRAAKRNGGKRSLDIRHGVASTLFLSTALRISKLICTSSSLLQLLISWFPLTLFTFFQWKLGSSDSYAPIILSVFIFLTTTASLVGLAFLCIRNVRRHSADKLLVLGGAAYTPFWNPFKPARWWFFIPLLVASFAEVAFVAFAQNRGWVQSVAMLVIELFILILMCTTVPWTDKSSNAFRILLQILKCAIFGALISFNRSIGLNEIVRVVIGAVIIVVEAVIVIALFALLIVDLVWILIELVRGIRTRRKMKQRGSGEVVDDKVMAEQGDGTVVGGSKRPSEEGARTLVMQRSRGVEEEAPMVSSSLGAPSFLSKATPSSSTVDDEASSAAQTTTTMRGSNSGALHPSLWSHT
ncbi:BZ3500_MvSof-1268-A1-R1_Chr9g10351 [Microbotryum saponariae]|uniref:BZ3500_MvSof-1268-A1-R1_Chr9g10351 protein n=1 Tax=Microbotryum saponariae TaxID=289078 RepID=A0A2X0L0A6_9BASI|nr:BZ3501_MvSof-1269-A2-R1_Chr9g10101 [Microbotryum saponariae]SCZ99951.1 BZ3500_MvSof-1268-A1-R1_Chr9g10351 [Microbotryum saponariae]